MNVEESLKLKEAALPDDESCADNSCILLEKDLTTIDVHKDKKQLQPELDDGEMEQTDFKFDLQKIHDFPGFNVSPDHKYLDLCRKFNTPCNKCFLRIQNRS